MLTGMQSPAIIFNHTGLTVRAAPRGDVWQGQLLDERGEVQDEFSYTREAFPGAVIGALRFTDLKFAIRLAARMWLHTEP
jgi:hypothetical protein